MEGLLCLVAGHFLPRLERVYVRLFCILGQREDIGPFVRDGNAMFEMGGRLSIRCDHGPLVCEDNHIIDPQIEHRFDRETMTGLDPRSCSALPVIGNMRLLVKTVTHPMSPIVPDDSVSFLVGEGLNGCTNIVNTISHNSRFDSDE